MSVKAKILLQEILEELNFSGNLKNSVDIIFERLADNDLFIISEKMLRNWAEKVLIEMEQNGAYVLEEVDIRDVLEL